MGWMALGFNGWCEFHQNLSLLFPFSSVRTPTSIFWLKFGWNAWAQYVISIVIGCTAKAVFSATSGLNAILVLILHWFRLRVLAKRRMFSFILARFVSSELGSAQWSKPVFLACCIRLQSQAGNPGFQNSCDLGVSVVWSLSYSMRWETLYLSISSRITRPHGSSGVAKAKFRSNLPPSAFGASVRVVSILWLQIRGNYTDFGSV